MQTGRGGPRVEVPYPGKQDASLVCIEDGLDRQHAEGRQRTRYFARQGLDGGTEKADMGVRVEWSTGTHVLRSQAAQ